MQLDQNLGRLGHHDQTPALAYRVYRVYRSEIPSKFDHFDTCTVYLGCRRSRGICASGCLNCSCHLQDLRVRLSELELSPAGDLIGSFRELHVQHRRSDEGGDDVRRDGVSGSWHKPGVNACRVGMTAKHIYVQLAIACRVPRFRYQDTSRITTIYKKLQKRGKLIAARR